LTKPKITYTIHGSMPAAQEAPKHQKLSRRRFLKLAAVTAATTALAGCTPPVGDPGPGGMNEVIKNQEADSSTTPVADK
jgi:hypothetical protein